jgi:hypothetical protein
MSQMLSNIFTSPRTTFAGILSVVLGALGATVLPQVVAYLGTQPGVGWQLVGLALGALGGALMKDVKKTP